MNKKKLPKFKNFMQEQQFWETHDSYDYINWSKAKIAKFPNLKLSTQIISTHDAIKYPPN